MKFFVHYNKKGWSMPNYSIRPRLDLQHGSTAIDKRGTLTPEDCFYAKRKKRRATLKVMAVIPPHYRVIKAELAEALKIQLKMSHRQNSFPIFTQPTKTEYCLQVGRPREVMVAEYRFNENGLPISESLYTGMISLTERYFFEDHPELPNATLLKTMLRGLISCDTDLARMSESEFLKTIRKFEGFNAEFVLTALCLFNKTCREFAKTHDIPFVAPPEKNGRTDFCVSNGRATFNKGLREPCSFINITNLANFLSGKEFFLSKEELHRYLPTHSK